MKTLFAKMVQSTLIVLLLAAPAAAQPTARYCQLGIGGRVVRDAALNGTVNFKFGPVVCGASVSTYSYLVLEVDYTHDQNGNVVVTCLTGQTTQTADKVPQGCGSISGGTCVATDIGVVSKAVTGNKKWTFRLGVRGYRSWSCSVTHDNSPTASDLVSVDAYLTD